jgi:hypothetical protein
VRAIGTIAALGRGALAIREHGGEPSSRQVDELLDERLAHRGRRESGVLERVQAQSE